MNSLALSLARYYLKMTNKVLYYLKYFSLKKKIRFALACEKEEKKKKKRKKKRSNKPHILQVDLSGPANILFAGVCARASTFLRPDILQAWENEGVKM